MKLHVPAHYQNHASAIGVSSGTDRKEAFLLR